MKLKVKGRTVIMDTYDLLRRIADRFAKEYEFFVAPYEADAQLAHFYNIEYVDAVFTVDSDLLLYGMKKVLRYNPNNQPNKSTICIQEYDLERLHEVENWEDFDLSKPEDLKKFQVACILRGCDYCESTYKKFEEAITVVTGESLKDRYKSFETSTSNPDM